MEKQVNLLKKNVKKKKFRKKRVKKEGSSYFRSLQKYECHSHIALFDNKEWHSSFTPYFGSGAQEWRSGVALKTVPLFNTYANSITEYQHVSDC